MPLEPETINIDANRTVDKNPCTLSKTGEVHPTHVRWVNHNKNADFEIRFEGESPFETKPIIAKKDGTPVDSGKIRDDAAEDSYGYVAAATEAGKEVAADPEIIITK